MAKRVISGALLVIIALVTILLGRGVLAVTLLLVSCIAFMEITKATSVHTPEKRINGLELAGVFGIFCYYGALYFCKDRFYLLFAILGSLIVFMFVYVFTFPKYQASQVMSTFFALIYAPVMLSFVYLTRELSYGIYLVWIIFISSWICDTCAYFVGVSIGKHKLTPKLSPKKSVEGAVGGVVGSALVGAIYAYLMADQIMADQLIWVFALLSAVGACISQVGDLAASGIKRNHNIKDYGKLIPGHGGIMDRFDSVIFTAPIIFFLCMIVAGVR